MENTTSHSIGLPERIGSILLLTAWMSAYAAQLILDNGLQIAADEFRFAPLALVALSLPPLLIGIRLRQTKIFAALAAPLTLIVLQLSGALYYHFQLGGDLSGSFLGRAINMIAVIPSFMIGVSAQLNRPFARNAAQVSVIFGIFGLTVMAMHLAGFIPWQNQVLHIEIVLLIAGPAYLALKLRSQMLAFSLSIFLVGQSLLTGKSTHALLGLAIIVLYYLPRIVSAFYKIVMKRGRRQGQVLLALGTPLIVAIAALSSIPLIAVIYERSTRKSSDPREVSFYTRIHEFMDSPVFGKVFAMSANLSDTVNIGTYTPSHNDILDVLAGGGMLGAALLFATVGRALSSREHIAMLFSFERNVARPSMVFWLTLAFYLFGATANPFYTNPTLAIPIWISVGFLIGAVYRHKIGNSVPLRRLGPKRRQVLA